MCGIFALAHAAEALGSTVGDGDTAKPRTSFFVLFLYIRVRTATLIHNLMTVRQNKQIRSAARDVAHA